jgi:hypothetical protein
VDTPFVAKAVAAAPLWLPDSLPVGLKQAVRVCAVLQYRDEAFMQACLQRGLQLLSPVRQQHANRQGGSSRPPSNGDRDDLAATCASAIARLDMQPLAGKAVELVLRSGVGQRPNTHPSNLSRLWVFHSWLLQHQLLDGKGLTGVVSQQQLQRGGQRMQLQWACAEVCCKQLIIVTPPGTMVSIHSLDTAHMLRIAHLTRR